MTIGGSIALIVVGAILAFAVEFDLAGININVVGYILIIAGIVGAIFAAVTYSNRRREVVRERPVERRRDVR